MDLEQVKSKCLQDIPGGNPCGEDPKYDSVYEEIREEIAKMAGIGHGATDWNKVVKQSLEMLETSAKEINLMTYLVAGLAITDGAAGLVVGLETYDAFLKQYWDTMYPSKKKVKIRARSVEWLNDRLTESRSEGQMDSKDHAQVTRIVELLETLKTTVADLFPEPPTNFRALRNGFDEHLATLEPEPEPEPEPEGEPETEGEEQAAEAAPKAEAKPAPPKKKPTAAKPAVAVELPALEEGASLDALTEILRNIAEQVRQANATEPMAYQLLRHASWTGAQLPRHDGSMQTMIPAPAPEQIESLKNMFSKAAWADLLARTDGLLSSKPLWLDLQFYGAMACTNLGPDYQGILNVIQFETFNLIEKLPKLQELKFDDGTPFASTQCRDWLSQLGALLGGAGAGGSDPVADMKSAVMQKGVDQFGDAMTLAQDFLDHARDPRESFRMKLEMTAFCLEAKQCLWAYSLCKSLAAQIDRHHLDSWEPSLAARAWSHMVRASRELKAQDARYAEPEKEAMARLAGLSFALAGQLPTRSESEFDMPGPPFGGTP